MRVGGLPWPAGTCGSSRLLVRLIIGGRNVWGEGCGGWSVVGRPQRLVAGAGADAGGAMTSAEPQGGADRGQSGLGTAERMAQDGMANPG